MALNWYLQIRNLSKTDEKALELYNNLQKAQTDDEKNTAKQQAQEYIKSISNDSGEDSSDGGETPHTETTNTDDIAPEDSVISAQDISDSEECDNQPVSVDTVSVPETPLQKDSESDEKEQEKIKLDLSQLAFNPRLAKCGITREEELFLAGVRVRKLTHDEKILLRRSIYEKKTKRNAALQAEFRKKRQEQRLKDLNDPEKIRYHQERKYVMAVVDALTQHKNMIYMFSQIDGLTPEILKELIKKPENANAINQANPRFLENFKKSYGE